MIHKVMLAASDILAMAAAFYLSFTLRNYFFSYRGGIYTPNFRHAFFLLSLMPLLLVYFRNRCLYRPLAMGRSIEHLELLFKSWLMFYGFFMAIIFFLRVKLFWEHRITMFMFLILGWGLLYAGRFVLIPLAIRVTRLYSRKPSNVICLGSAAEAIRVRDLVIRESMSNQRVIGFLDDGDGQAAPDTLPRLGSLDDLESILGKHEVSEAFVRMSPVDWNRLTMMIQTLAARRVRLRIAMDQFGALAEKVTALPEAEYGYIFINESPLYRAENIIKRAMDRVLAAVALLILSPLFLVLTLLIRLDSPGPAFFRQKRAGLNGQEFDVFKFRSMRRNTEEHHREAVRRLINGDHDFLAQESKQTGFLKATDTAQVTRIGQFLRKTSLDELPQLINVLAGDISLVGPRPLPLYEVELFQPWQHFRHSVRPGITGFWQVFGRSSVSHADTILMDIFYIMNWSLSLDLRIIVRTLYVLLTGKGAL